MGELRTRKRGKTWEWSFEGSRIGGKRNPISKGGYRTKAEALTAGTQAKAEYDNTGRSFKPSEISVSDYLDYWLEEYVKRNLAHNTYLDYATKIRLHIKPEFGKYRLSAIEPDTVQRWIDRKKDCGLSKGMLKNLLSCLSGAMNYAVLPLKYISSNPCIYVKIGKIAENQYLKEHREYILPQEDFSRIIDRFGPDSPYYLPLMLGYYLGTRIGESYGFDLLEDVDFKTHTISINHQMQCEGGTWYQRPPKYDSFRILKMGQAIEKAIKREITSRKKNQLKYGKYYTKTYITPENAIVQVPAHVEVPYKEIMPASAHENGEIMTPNSFRYCARVCHNELGLPLFHSHCLRHTHGTILAENGARPKAVMERLGHKDISVTMNTYVFNTDKMQQDAVDIFERAASGLAYHSQKW